MRTPVVCIKLRVRLPDGSRRYLNPVFSGNNKLKPGWATLEGKATSFAKGVYHLRYLNGTRRVWEPVGEDSQFALVSKHKRERALGAKAAGLAIVGDGAEPAPKTNLNAVAVDYLFEIKTHKSKKTHAAYSLVLTLFKEFRSKGSDGKQSRSKESDGEDPGEAEHFGYVEDIGRKEILAFKSFLEGKGNGPRTVSNRIANLKRFWNYAEVEWPLKKNDTPTYTEKSVSAYSATDIQCLLAAADREESELVQFFLFTGGREQEVQFAAWPDVDLDTKTFTIREKLDLGFTPKDKEEAPIPIPDSLVELLRARHHRFPDSRLIFTNTQGNANGHLLRILKRLGLRAGLNCGHCISRKGLSCSKHAVCSRFELHRLRKTFATMHHEAGVPVRTIQRWLRHSSLETTLRYLASSDDQSQRGREQVNKTFAAFTQAGGAV